MVTNSIAGETYVLQQCGAPAPDAAQFPAGTKFFTVPLTALSAPETVPYAFVVRWARSGAAVVGEVVGGQGHGMAWHGMVHGQGRGMSVAEARHGMGVAVPCACGIP